MGIEELVGKAGMILTLGVWGLIILAMLFLAASWVKEKLGG